VPHLRRSLAVLPFRVAAIAVSIALPAIGLTAAPVRSADRLILTYGSLARTVEIGHLAALCDTGALPAAARELRAGMAMFDLDAEALCEPLTETIEVDLLDLDAALHTQIGEDLLFVVGQAIHNRPRVAPIAALRGTLLTAAADRQISALELLQHYPTPDVAIDLTVLLGDTWFDDNLSNVTRDFSWDGFR